MAKLIIHEGGRETVHEILEDSLVIGRKEGVAVRVSDAEAGNEHCQLSLVPGVGFKLVDLESRSGTKVNGAFVNQHLLRNGDVIQVGQVRIDFSGEGVAPAPAPIPPAAPTPLAAPAVRMTPGRPAAPARPVRAAPAFRPPEEREGRPLRYPRRPSNAPIVVFGVIVGMLVFVLATIVFVAPWFRHGHNQTLYEEMRDKYDEAQGHYAPQKRPLLTEIIAQAGQADDGGDKKWLRKIRALEIECKEQLAGLDSDSAGKRIWAEFNRLDLFHKHGGASAREVVAKWDEFISKYSTRDPNREPLYVLKAIERRREAEDGLAGGGGGAAKPPPTTQIGKAWAAAEAKSLVQEKEDRYQEAMDLLLDFMEENKLKIPPGKSLEWERKVSDAVRGVESRADRKWSELHGAATRHLAGGRTAEAIAAYQRVIDRFGIPKYERMAQDARNRLRR